MGWAGETPPIFLFMRVLLVLFVVLAATSRAHAHFVVINSSGYSGRVLAQVWDGDSWVALSGNGSGNWNGTVDLTQAIEDGRFYFRFDADDLDIWVQTFDGTEFYTGHASYPDFYYVVPLGNLPRLQYGEAPGPWSYRDSDISGTVSSPSPPPDLSVEVEFDDDDLIDAMNNATIAVYTLLGFSTWCAFRNWVKAHPGDL